MTRKVDTHNDTPDDTPSTPTLTGIVARVVEDRGFFFIKSDENKQDYFCHVSSLQGCTLADLPKGQRVSFVGTDTEKGYRAEHVEKIVL